MKRTLPAMLLLAMLLSGCVSTSERRVQLMEAERDEKRSQGLPAIVHDSALSDYLTYAALSNPGLEAAFNEWKAADARIAQSKSLPDPRFSYAYFIEAVETRVGPQRQTFELSQTFPWFGTLGLKGDVATEAAEAAYQQYEQAKLKLFYRVKKNYYEYAFLARAIAITKRNMKLLSELETIARARFKTSAGSHGAVIKAQLELGRLEDRLKSLEDFETPLKAKLNASLNRPHDAALSRPTTIPEIDVSLSEDALFSLLRASSPELKSLEHLAAKATAGLPLARKRYYPDIMIGAGLMETDESERPGVADSGNDPVVAMIGISLPIWQGSYRAGVREATARKQAAANRLEARENDLLADVQLAFYHFRDANRKLSLYGKGLIPKARESLQVNRQAFESGNVSFLDVLDSERVLLEFELSHERALANRAQRLAELEMLIGRELTGKNNKGGK